MSPDKLQTHFKFDKSHGLTNDQVSELYQKHGPNEIPQQEQESILEKILEQFRDPMVKLLSSAAMISFIISILSNEQNQDSLPPWIEPLVIFLILIANSIIGIY